MPFCPGTGIPYGRSPFAFSGGTVEARSTLTAGVNFTSWTTFVGCPTGVAEAVATFDIREPGRREGGFVFFSV